MAVMKQKNLRQAEKTLKDILDKADNNANGRVDIKEFVRVLESNGVEVRFLKKSIYLVFFRQ